MAELTFFSVLKSNITCATCKKHNCAIRYMPNGKLSCIYDGKEYVSECEKINKHIKIK
jgi:hypothetical protein